MAIFLEWLVSTLINTLSTGAVLAFLVWIFKETIKTRLTASIKHEFETKLAALKSELHKNEEIFKADLRKKENEILALRSGALSAMASRQTLFDKRTLEAVDQIWNGMHAMTPASGIAKAMSAWKWDVVEQRIEIEPKLKEMYLAFGKVDPKEVLDGEGWKGRPYVSKLTLAYFSAYRAIVGLSVGKLALFQLGLGGNLMDTERIVGLVTAALPHQEAYVKQFGVTVLANLLDELEDKLLQEMERMLKGAESDLASVQRAVEILIAVEKVNADNRVADANLPTKIGR